MFLLGRGAVWCKLIKIVKIIDVEGRIRRMDGTLWEEEDR